MDSKTAWNELKIGVLALQGAFSEHLVVFKSLSVSAIPVKTPADLAQVHGLVIPGGESTTIIKLCERNGLVGEIQEFIKNGRPVWGICAGLILLAKEATHGKVGGQSLIGGLDIIVKRNAFGHAQDSFCAPINFRPFGQFPGVFIRAPIISSVGPGVEILAEIEQGIVAGLD